MRRGTVVVAVAGAALVFGLAARSARVAPRAPAPTAKAPSAERAPSEPRALAPEAVVPASSNAAEPRPPSDADVLLARLGSEDAFVVLDAADALAARRVTRAIPRLASLPLDRMPNAAPSVIASLGKLAGVAAPPERAHAVGRLLDVVAHEKERRAPESDGNVLVAYEALGHTRDAAAARALEAELRDPGVSNAAKTVIVASLARLGDPSSRAVLASARAEAAAARIGDAFEDEVREDLVAALDRALAD